MGLVAVAAGLVSNLLSGPVPAPLVLLMDSYSCCGWPMGLLAHILLKKNWAKKDRSCAGDPVAYRS